MAYIIPNQGDSYIMSAAFQIGSGTFLSLNLFKSSPATAAMTASAVSADYTVLTGGGYTEKLIHRSAWCVPYLSAGSAEVSASGDGGASPGFKFSFSAAPNESAFGYMISHTAANRLIVAETFASNYFLQNQGDTITILPKIRAT